MSKFEEFKQQRERKETKLFGTLTWPFKVLGKGALFLARGKLLIDTTGASFAKQNEYGEYLHSANNGLLLNGDDARLSLRESFQNVCVIAGIGAGKTTRYIIPNVLAQARKRCSLVVNDPKGEVFEATSGYMEKSGFKVVLIDPENLSRSSCFNPLMEARDNIELEQVAEILVRSGIPGHGNKDDFWLQGAIRFVSLFIKCLKNAGLEDGRLFTLHNLYYLFQNFGEDGRALDDFMSRYTVNPDNPNDETLWNEWNGLLIGNKEGVQSFVLNAITSLKSLSNQNLARMTSSSDIELENIRSEKTIIYMVTPAQHAEYYSFLTSLFFRSVFNACMRKMPDKKTLPVFVLYDEFGHATIPNFVSTANTIRGYKVSLSIILQSISQLSARYGHEYANSIQGGFKTYVTYAGSDPATTSFFEFIIGKVRERQRRDFDEHISEYREYNLLNANEIRAIAENQMLIVSGNKQPVMMKTTPYYEHWRFRRFVRAGESRMTAHQNHEENLSYVNLKG